MVDGGSIGSSLFLRAGGTERSTQIPAPLTRAAPGKDIPLPSLGIGKKREAPGWAEGEALGM